MQAPAPGLRRIGAELLADSQAAFTQQSFEGIRWPERYPNDGAPKINYAGALTDLNRGQAPKARRFQDRPALIDTSKLRRSLQFSVSGFSVEEGSPLSYAGRLNRGSAATGSVSVIPVTSTAKKKLSDVLRSARRAVHKAKTVAQQKQATLKRDALAKLGFLFQRRTLVTENPERPFVGLSQGSADRAGQTFAQWLES